MKPKRLSRFEQVLNFAQHHRDEQTETQWLRRLTNNDLRFLRSIRVAASSFQVKAKS